MNNLSARPRGYMPHTNRFHFDNIDHTADKAIVAHGRTYREMLESAAAGMFAQQLVLESVPRGRTWRVTAEAESAEDLLVAWLRELLILSEDEEVALCDFRITSFSEWRVEADVWGAPYTHKVHRTGAARQPPGKKTWLIHIKRPNSTIPSSRLPAMSFFSTGSSGSYSIFFSSSTILG